MKQPLLELFKFRKRQEPVIIFLHIPKTAGTTLQTIINKQFKREYVYELDNSNAQKSMEKFQHLPDSEKQKYKVILGHMWFGLHRYLPRASTYITVLRDPVDRVVSHYYFVKRRKDHYLHDIVESQRLSLKEYIENGLSTELNNGQTRLLSGCIDEKAYPFGKCPGALLEQAKKNLDRYFSIVGIQEEFTDTLSLIRKVLGWSTPDFKENVTVNRPPKDEIPAETVAIIRHFNQLDIELYGYARRIFTDLKQSHLE